MPDIHNQINRLWYKPSYQSFKRSKFVKRIFTERDANDFLETGRFLIKRAEEFSHIIIPWDERMRFEILKKPRLENAFISLGAEYLLKGVFLTKGYVINKPTVAVNIANHPFRIRGNKKFINPSEVQTFGYITKHLPAIIDFSGFDKKQKMEEKKAKDKLHGQRLKGMTRMTIPYPSSTQLLDYLLFKRNYSLHRPFIIPEFKGTTNQLFDLLNYISQQLVATP